MPKAVDVLVVGSGAAGLYSALCLPESYQVGVVTKEPLAQSASDWAQGGIAAAIAPDDSSDLHFADTLRAGAGLCDAEAVTRLVSQASDCIHHLVDLGVAFDRQGKQLALTLEAAHSQRRVLHAADTTGRAVVTTLVKQVHNRPNLQVIQGFVLELWIEDGTCRGVILVQQQQIRAIAARAVILATGGGGQVFAQTTNPALSTGDGVAMAWRSGALLRDLEFVQFHPTALTYPGAPHFLISEAVRGEGAHLLDDQHRRFAFDYHPDGELAPRDVVSRAIFSHLQKTYPNQPDAHVWLDLRPIPPDRIRHRFPNIIQVCQRWGIDILSAPVPVAPAAHYWMGGVFADHHNQTTLPNLYAIGEVASTGVHGANRLASNSLLECLVFGAQFRQLVLPERELPTEAGTPCTIALSEMEPEASEKLAFWRSHIPIQVWQSAGICRDAPALEEAIAKLQQWREDFQTLALTQALMPIIETVTNYPIATKLAPSLVRSWGEVRNLLDIGTLILQCAQFRTESRGGHYRRDYPERDDGQWQRHTLIQGNHVWRSPQQTAQAISSPDRQDPTT